jgi:phage-related protein
MRYFETIFLREAHDFIESQNQKTRMKILYNIDRAAQSIDATLFKKLDDDIWEFRTRSMGSQIRLLAFWDSQTTSKTLVVATHGFIKKLNQVPQREIERASAARKKYFYDEKNK